MSSNLNAKWFTFGLGASPCKQLISTHEEYGYPAEQTFYFSLFIQGFLSGANFASQDNKGKNFNTDTLYYLTLNECKYNNTISNALADVYKDLKL